MNDREWATAFGGNDSWYWSREHGSYVLIVDGKTTPADLGKWIEDGLGRTKAETDFWAMAAALVSQRRLAAA